MPDSVPEIEEEAPRKVKKKKRPIRVLAILLSIVLFFEALYCFVVFTDIPAIKALREQYIETALQTMTHQWLARAFLPNYMVENVRIRDEYLKLSQDGLNSDNSDRNPSPSGNPSDPPSEPTDPEPSNSADPVNDSEEAFYETFWELNRASFESYVDKHPETLSDGWENIYIDESGINESGTEIYTSMGEQVLAIDAQNKVLLVRVHGSKNGNGYQGVLAIAKDPAQLRCEPSAGIGSYGQGVGVITANSGGMLGMSASGFFDPEGAGTGGDLSGYAMCKGVPYGAHSAQVGDKRIELAENNRFYINDAAADVPADTTDAVEFSPALIVDGELVTSGFDYWGGINPRAAIGQSEKGEILMLVIEGRQIGRSIGTDVAECADILMRHKGYTAMNLDGGTTAVMWFHGKYVTKCSNENIESRNVPNAWVYGNYE